jgi:riboflavin synthase alpha subunit
VFTGIVEEVGEVEDAHAGELRVRADKVLEETKVGDSIAVDGVDLTVTAIIGPTLRFEVMPETYRQTTLTRLRRGTRSTSNGRSALLTGSAVMSCEASSRAWAESRSAVKTATRP